MSYAEGLRIRDVQRIWNFPDRPLHTEQDIEKYVEEPLQRAATMLVLQKGIRTYYSTANARDTIACILLEPRYLSPENIAIAKAHFGYRGEDELERVCLELPINPDTPVVDVETCFCNLAELFADQQEWNKSHFI